MKRLLSLTFLLVLVTSCGQDYNSNSGDYGQYAPVDGLDSTTPDGERLLAAYKVMQTKCFQCHQWSEYKSSAQWVSSGMVIAGNASASDLYTSLKNVGGSMPKDPLAQLPEAEFKSIEAWIEGIQ